MAMAQSKGITFTGTHKFLNTLFSEDVHAKRIYSLANSTLGVISSASLAVNTIGQGLALARGRLTKHAIKQVDRLLSNQGIEVDELLMRWVPPMWWGSARILLLPWIGPTLTLITSRRLCCR
jgi:hypothetical protein